MTRGPESNDMIAVTIGVPTYRRPELLEALLRTLPSRIAECADLGIAVDVLVVDNDPAGSGRDVAAGADLPVRYVVEPAPGIAAARNRILDECVDRDLVAFIDDDEIPGRDGSPPSSRSGASTGPTR